MFLIIESICSELGISYHEPLLPVELEQNAQREVVCRPENGKYALTVSGGGVN